MQRKTMSVMSVFLIAFLAFGTFGCTMVKLLARGNQPIILNSPPEKYVVLGHFKKSKEITFDYTRSPDITGIVREAVVSYPDADAVINTFITVESTVGDFFFNLFTIGLANAYTLSVEGDVIKYQK